MPTYRHSQQGFTLVEFSLVIAGTLTLLAVTAVAAAQLRARTESVQRNAEIDAVDSAIHTIYSEQWDYTSPLLSIANIWPALPANLKTGAVGAALPVPGGGTLIVQNYNGTRYGIVLSNLQTDACIDVVTARGANYYLITVGSTYLKNLQVGAPVDVAAAATACAGTPAQHQVLLLNG